MVEAECQGRSSRARPSPNHRIVAPPSPPPTPAAPRSFLLPFTQPLGGASWFWACLSPTSAASLFAAALVNWERVAEGETPPPALFDRQRSQKRPGLAARKQHLSRAPPPPPHFLSPPPPPPSANRHHPAHAVAAHHPGLALRRRPRAAAACRRRAAVRGAHVVPRQGASPGGVTRGRHPGRHLWCHSGPGVAFGAAPAAPLTFVRHPDPTPTSTWPLRSCPRPTASGCPSGSRCSPPTGGRAPRPGPASPAARPKAARQRQQSQTTARGRGRRRSRCGG
jgi:hypothetical protein